MRRVGFVAVILVGCVGCGTPDAVKKLSSAQTQTMVSYENTLKLYFAVMVKFADAQVQAINGQIDSLTQGNAIDFKTQALNKLNSAADAAAREKILNAYTSTIQDDASLAEEQKQQIAVLVGKLKDKQTEMLSAFHQMVTAQQKLDEYIQLKKTDDVILDQLVATLGINKEKLEQAGTDIVGVTNEVNKILSDVKGAKKQ